VLYKVTPLLTPVEAKKPATDSDAPTKLPKEARKRRKSAVFDADGNEVLITMMCLKCRAMKPLAMFGLRKMADGAIRNQPWCRGCRSGASTPKKKPEELEQVAEAVVVQAAPAAPAEPVRTEPLSALEQLMAGPV
jgi:hypothetical protein